MVIFTSIFMMTEPEIFVKGIPNHMMWPFDSATQLHFSDGFPESLEMIFYNTSYKMLNPSGLEGLIINSDRNRNQVLLWQIHPNLWISQLITNHHFKPQTDLCWYFCWIELHTAIYYEGRCHQHHALESAKFHFQIPGKRKPRKTHVRSRKRWFFSKYLELPKIVSASFHDDFLHQRWIQSKISINDTLLVTWDFKNHIHLILERQLRVEAFHLNHGRVGKGHVENWLPFLESESNLSLPQIIYWYIIGFILFLNKNARFQITHE